MDLLFATSGGDLNEWMAAFSKEFPDAHIRAWREGDNAPADFAFVWKPPVDALRDRAGLKGIFNLGAGVDGILKLDAQSPGALPKDVPVIKVDDAGMAAQMSEYVLYVLLRHFRRFDDYEKAQRNHEWASKLPAYRREDFPVAIMGLGELGAQVAKTVSGMGFPTRGWSRSEKRIDGVDCYAGEAAFDAFLDNARVLVTLLPDTPETREIINRRLLGKLAKGAYVINVARGSQVADADLLAAIAEGQIAGATLDVFHEEPLPADHPFWSEPRVTITPHVAARTLVPESTVQIAEKMRRLIAGQPVSGVIDRSRGY